MSARSTGQQRSESDSNSSSSSSILDKAWDSFVITIGSLVGQSSSTGTITTDKTSSSKSKDKSSTDDKDTDLSEDLLALGIELTLRLVIACASSYLLLWFGRKFLGPPIIRDPNQDQQQEMIMPENALYRRLAEILSKRNTGDNKNNIELPILTPYERQMAQEIVDPDDIECQFQDIGGLDSTKREIYELAILPLIKPNLFKGSKLVQPCKGILLYGNPGTGKTMLAKALSKEAQAIFIPLQLSKILNKWVGESNKLIAATFSLANKLQPSIIFIDELDTFLKANNNETAYLDSIKAEFLTLWDGISTSSTSRVLVLGATNKPQTIDSAILRRMPRAFHVPLPNEQGRLSILTLILKDENVTQDVMKFLPDLVKLTRGYSGSDLKELCKAAAMISVQERTAQFAHEKVMGLDTNDGEEDVEVDSLRPMSIDDLLIALKKVRRTGAAAQEYGRVEGRRQQQQRQQRDGNDLSINPNSLRGLTAFLRSLSVLPDDDNNEYEEEEGKDNNEDNNNSDYDDDDDMPNM